LVPTEVQKGKRSKMVNYAVTWYCIQRSNGDCFPDGLKVPPLRVSAFARSPRKLIWIKLDRGTSWYDAITFGPALRELEIAASDFGATNIVWLEPFETNAYMGGAKKKSV